MSLTTGNGFFVLPNKIYWKTACFVAILARGWHRTTSFQENNLKAAAGRHRPNFVDGRPSWMVEECGSRTGGPFDDPAYSSRDGVGGLRGLGGGTGVLQVATWRNVMCEWTAALRLDYDILYIWFHEMGRGRHIIWRKGLCEVDVNALLHQKWGNCFSTTNVLKKFRLPHLCPVSLTQKKELAKWFYVNGEHTGAPKPGELYLCNTCPVQVPIGYPMQYHWYIIMAWSC